MADPETMPDVVDALQSLLDRQDLTFAECSLAEEWADAASVALAEITRLRAERAALRARVETLEDVLKPTEDLTWILGRPNFACVSVAALFRAAGASIPHRAEDEQAYVIRQMLECYFESREAWRDLFETRVTAARTALKEKNDA